MTKTDGDVTFTRDGRPVRARPGQSVAAALWAHGDRAFSRSSKFHRPRGWSCGIGKCADCVMRVDGVPSVRTCVTPARNGMHVESQNAWPNARHDIFRLNDIVFRRFDHHRWFVRPRILYPLFGKVIRAFAGWGQVPQHAPPAASAEARTPDVLVIGGGPAGLAAAEAAASAGAHVLLLDEGQRLGGHGARMHRTLPDPDGTDVARPMREWIEQWLGAVAGTGNVTVETGIAVAAAYRNGLFIAHGRGRALAIRARATVIATGAYHAEAHFINNDLPGVMGAQGCQALLHREGVTPGTRALVYGAGAHGLHIALDLHAAGVAVATIAEPRDTVPGPAELVEAAHSAGIPLITDSTLQRADGFGRVRRATLRRADGNEELVRCDLIVIATGSKTTPEFFQALGATLRYRPEAGGAVPLLDIDLQTTVPGVFAAGDTAGVGTLATARASGRLAGLAAAAHAGHAPPALAPERTRLRARLAALAGAHGGPVAAPDPVSLAAVTP